MTRRASSVGGLGLGGPVQFVQHVAQVVQADGQRSRGTCGPPGGPPPGPRRCPGTGRTPREPSPSPPSPRGRRRAGRSPGRARPRPPGRRLDGSELFEERDGRGQQVLAKRLEVGGLQPRVVGRRVQVVADRLLGPGQVLVGPLFSALAVSRRPPSSSSPGPPASCWRSARPRRAGRPVRRPPAAASIALFRRANLRNRYPADGGQASHRLVGQVALRRPSARPLAVSYRRFRSFSRAFITIQSSSPRTSRVSLAGSICRWAAIAGRRSFESLSRVLGRGGSSSRITRSTSSRAASWTRFWSAASSRSAARTGGRPGEYTSDRVSMSRLFSSACSGLMYSGVPTTAPNPVTSVCSVSGCPAALATPKSITFDDRLAVVRGDQDVRRLEVPVDDPLLVGVLDRLADLDEQLQPLRGVSRCSSQYFVIGHALDQLHDEERAGRRPSARRRRPWRCSGGPSGPAPAARPRTGPAPDRCPSRP